MTKGISTTPTKNFQRKPYSDKNLHKGTPEWTKEQGQVTQPSLDDIDMEGDTDAEGAPTKDQYTEDDGSRSVSSLVAGSIAGSSATCPHEEEWSQEQQTLLDILVPGTSRTMNGRTNM